MTAIYKPIGIVFGILSGLLAKRVFTWVWGRIDEEEPPEPTTRYTPFAKLVAAAVLQGSIFRLTRVFVDRSLAKGWHYIFGVWPGERRAEPVE